MSAPHEDRVDDAEERDGHGPSPPVLLASLYGAAILVGAALLKLPFGSREALTWSDALFTATSAVTVTGLVVIEPVEVLSGFGQAVVLLLIQLGGVGLMTSAVAILSSLGVYIGRASQRTMQEELEVSSLAELIRLGWLILRIALVAELVGACALAAVFVPDFGWRTGSWHALFHAVSAFNNAGFTLVDESLPRYALHPVFVATMPALFIVGGLGFAVLADLNNRCRWSELALHTRLMLSGTAVLILVPTALVCALEWRNPATLAAHDGVLSRIALGAFHAATTRTAGFDPVDPAELEDATALLTIVLMFIGGGSTSTAGGIKVVTFIVLVLATAAYLRRRARPRAFGRTIGADDVAGAMALVTLAGLFVTAVLFVLLATQSVTFLPMLFETASAFGTVGLSMGATTELDDVGRALIGLVMFIGRIGPLTLGFLLAASTPPDDEAPDGPLHLG